jgi:hypothetical protein
VTSAYTMAPAVVFAGVALVVRRMFALACVLVVSGCGLSATQAACIAGIEAEEAKECGSKIGECADENIGAKYDAEIATRCAQ